MVVINQVNNSNDFGLDYTRSRLMKKILILAGRYLPGYKDGGPVRSILNLSEWMGDEYDLRIMCHDRDHGDTERYPNIKVDEWNQVGKAKVWYTESFDIRTIATLADEADVVYSCGPYNNYAIYAMRLKKNGRMKAPLVIASMGSFSPEAFAIKGKKKELFVKAMKFAGYFKKVVWSVTSTREEEELKAIIGQDAKCMIASDLARKGGQEHLAVKEDNALKVIFLSRISRKKNLVVVPDILKITNPESNISIDVFGIAEDEDYLKECLEKFGKLPSNIKWEYKGEIDSEGVPRIFSDYDAFLFPTLGENYGHVIAESLGAGCVPVISDTTPWLDLDENKSGYVCSLNDLSSFAKALDELAVTNGSDYEVLVENCISYIEKKKEEDVASSGYRTIFEL